ncbi:MAG TPA: hypothetical protein VJT33_00195 [bacterium]|nr:hypothetical protein [bacterium]
MAGDVPDCVFGLSVAGITYVVGYQNFKQGKLKQAKTGSLIMGIVAGVGFLTSAGLGNMILMLLDAGAAAGLIYSSTKL